MPEVATPPKPSSLGEAFAAASAKLAQQEPPKQEIPKNEPLKEEPKKEEPPKEVKKEEAPPVLEENLNPNLVPKKVEEPAKPSYDDDTPKGMTKEAQQGFAAKRKALAEAQQTIAATSAENAELKAKLDAAASSAPEITRLKAELEEAQKIIKAHADELSIARIESTSQYKQAVAAPMQEVEGIVAKLAQVYELKPSAILDAIKEPDFTKRAEAIEEVTEGMKGLERDAVIEAAKTYQKAQKIAEDMRGNAKVKLEEIAVRSKRDEDGQASAAAEEYRKNFDQEWKAIQEKNPLLRPVEGQDKWNEYLARIQRDGQGIDVNNVNAADIARSVAAERALPELARVVEHYQKANTDLTAKLEKAQARLAEYVATTPGAGEGHNGNDSTSTITDKMTMGERIAARSASTA